MKSALLAIIVLAGNAQAMTTYAANVNCAGASFRADLVRISTSEDGPAAR